ncbi:hypothetical protein C1646_761818 [Rhizophagus diaphanus]|nr:hypothetical protein C1646_761818 [Rhizophagus diaphanus] [Rhizophagus sp. MUCL 43196]
MLSDLELLRQQILKSCVAGNDHALDEQSQDVKEVIAEMIAVSAVNISDSVSSKALQMSKLRAVITYGQHLHNNPTSIKLTLDINENVRNDGPAANLETNSEPIGDDSDDEITEPWLENDFGEYLQGWTEMLEEEKNAELDEETEEQSNILIGYVAHPTNNANAKWNLIALFNNNIVNLPF